jgi:hypothetical protein
LRFGERCPHGFLVWYICAKCNPVVQPKRPLDN